MDPNETLKAIREAIAALNVPTDDTDAAWETVDQLVENFTALDEFLCAGGFPPAVWTH
jgi:hypothetical protein